MNKTEQKEHHVTVVGYVVIKARMPQRFIHVKGNALISMAIESMFPTLRDNRGAPHSEA